MNSVATYYLPSDRLKLMLFLATLLHIVIILGIGFATEEREQQAPQLEITLAQYKSKEPVKDVDFLAQWDQLGSGSEAKKSELSTPEVALFQSDQIREVDQSPPPNLNTPATKPTQLKTLSESETRINDQQQNEPLPTPVEKSNRIDPQLLEKIQSISSLEAQLDAQKRAYAQIPRVHRVTSMSTRRAIDAEYLHTWRNKIEAIGNRHYPDESRRNGIYGSLRLLVAIRADGSLKDIEILASSGHPVLDEAAVRIVRMASPYAPFPKELRETTDVLEIIRTWQFRQNRLSSR